MFRWMVILLLGISFASVVSAKDPSKSKLVQRLGPVTTGEVFPSFGGHRLNGEYLSLRGLLHKEQVIVVSYFATWCAPCRVGLKNIEELSRRHSNLQAVYISVGDKAPELHRFKEELGLQNPIVLDKFESIAKRHGVVSDGAKASLPKTFVLSPSGEVLAIFTMEGEDFQSRLTAFLP